MTNATERAAQACRSLAYWQGEVQRLSAEIRAVRCPNERGYDPPYEDEPHPSCFAAAKEPVTRAITEYGEEKDFPTLDEIAAEVSDCPACWRLCQLIRERKAAKRKRTAAKCATYAAGRAVMLAEAPHA